MGGILDRVARTTGLPALCAVATLVIFSPVAAYAVAQFFRVDQAAPGDHGAAAFALMAALSGLSVLGWLIGVRIERKVPRWRRDNRDDPGPDR